MNHKWISTKDRLPEPGQKFVCFTKWGNVTVEINRTWGEPPWTVGGLEPVKDYSFWMPLPGLPGEDPGWISAETDELQKRAMTSRKFTILCINKWGEIRHGVVSNFYGSIYIEFVKDFTHWMPAPEPPRRS